MWERNRWNFHCHSFPNITSSHIWCLTMEIHCYRYAFISLWNWITNLSCNQMIRLCCDWVEMARTSQIINSMERQAKFVYFLKNFTLRSRSRLLVQNGFIIDNSHHFWNITKHPISSKNNSRILFESCYVICKTWNKINLIDKFVNLFITVKKFFISRLLKRENR